jgi:hypothetical protein
MYVRTCAFSDQVYLIHGLFVSPNNQSRRTGLEHADRPEFKPMRSCN